MLMLKARIIMEHNFNNSWADDLWGKGEIVCMCFFNPKNIAQEDKIKYRQKLTC